MSVVVTAVFHPAEGKRNELIAAFEATIPGVHTEQGCLLYAIHDAADGTITMIEKWASVEDLDAHGSSPQVEALRAAVSPLVGAPTVVTRMTALPTGTKEQGEL
ncbi:MAG TPA: putative quinol monooxygenase [Propionibacteriaceae bacterium]|nr:putative quinol monooxygenase [Propionibacteriaceae bacterium]HPZ50533.1 putative quinol monooxygenase [Propionibacteriaceae bacterium]HQE32127.1 putative quinol monooxygenase [Propionibacteriaceae bacterium]